jgi:hypothetical protein
VISSAGERSDEEVIAMLRSRVLFVQEWPVDASADAAE